MMMFSLGHYLISPGACQAVRQGSANAWVRIKLCQVLQKFSRPAETGQVIAVSQREHSRRDADTYRQMLPSLFVRLSPTLKSRALRTTPILDESHLPSELRH